MQHSRAEIHLSIRTVSGHAVRFALMVPVLLTLTVTQSPAQQTSTVGSQLAPLLQSLSLLRGNADTAGDVRLTGTVQYTAGSQNETGTVTLISRPDGAVRTDITLPSGTRSQVRFPAGSTNGNVSIDPGSAVQPIARHNSLVVANWFFPEHLVGILGGASRTVKTLDPSQCAPTLVCIASQMSGPDPSSSAYFAKTSAMTVSLDATSMQPVQLDFAMHPNDQPSVVVPIKVLYRGYQTVAGHSIPFHIQQYVNGSLFLDITLSNVDMNPSIVSSDLTIR